MCRFLVLGSKWRRRRRPRDTAITADVQRGAEPFPGEGEIPYLVGHGVGVVLRESEGEEDEGEAEGEEEGNQQPMNATVTPRERAEKAEQRRRRRAMNVAAAIDSATSWGPGVQDGVVFLTLSGQVGTGSEIDQGTEVNLRVRTLTGDLIVG